jgi:hypothetical protein
MQTHIESLVKTSERSIFIACIYEGNKIQTNKIIDFEYKYETQSGCKDIVVTEQFENWFSVDSADKKITSSRLSSLAQILAELATLIAKKRKTLSIMVFM